MIRFWLHCVLRPIKPRSNCHVLITAYFRIKNMNTIETSRLVRRIVSALKGEGDSSLSPKLAEDFTAVCSSLNLRLEQCLAMIDAGAAAQAVQLAETQPNLLDLVTLVEFRQADEWRQFCVSKGLACAEKLNPKAVTTLNDCYARGITPQHPVYAAYREAVLAKNDEAALATLKSIVRLNPSDNNAVSELTRLDAKILKIRLLKLEQLLSTNETAAMQELNDIEAIGFKAELAGAVWQRAQLIRCGKLLSEADEIMSRGDLAEVVIRLDYLAQLKSDHKLDWPFGWEEQIAKLQNWCHSESSARQESENFDQALAELRQAVYASKERSTRLQKSTISGLKKELEGLRRLFRQVEIFSRDIPTELQQDFTKQSGQLEVKIRKQVRSRQMRMVAAVSLAAIILVVMALAFLGLQRANLLTDDLRKAVDQHQVRTLENLLKQANSKMLLPTARLKSACAAAVVEINQQYPGLLAYEEAFKRLPTQLDSLTTLKQLDEVALNFAAAQKLQRNLTGDLQPRHWLVWMAFGLVGLITVQPCYQP